MPPYPPVPDRQHGGGSADDRQVVTADAAAERPEHIRWDPEHPRTGRVVTVPSASRSSMVADPVPELRGELGAAPFVPQVAPDPKRVRDHRVSAVKVPPRCAMRSDPPAVERHDHVRLLLPRRFQLQVLGYAGDICTLAGHPTAKLPGPAGPPDTKVLGTDPAGHGDPDIHFGRPRAQPCRDIGGGLAIEEPNTRTGPGHAVR